ncbi:ABC transporter ATP-binding protein [Paenibacillus sp. TAB 01]|uniref:ABC transporter ATP-binding protein n=1 Tax=Paenibacillus sp. TAB 01 TaxID=3368988 RepID=UPI003752EEE7
MRAIETKQISLDVGMFQLKDVNISIPAGKITAIVGPNGSGKSTLLKVLTRLVRPDHGEVYILDRLSRSFTSLEFARTVSMLTQSKSALPDLTVRELITFGRSPHKRMFVRMNEEDEEAVEWAMQATGTKRLEHRMFHTLSGGEQQKARIAMALAQKTGIILLDEPTTFLDIAHQLDVMEMLQKINLEYRMTIVMVLHDLQQAAHYCHYLLAMKNGKLVTSGEPRHVIHADFLKQVYQINARVSFEDEYPIIIPMKTLPY